MSNYKDIIIKGIKELNEPRSGSSLQSIKKYVQANMPKGKEYKNGMFLLTLKHAVTSGTLTQVKGSYKISAEHKKTAAKKEPKANAKKPAEKKTTAKKSATKKTAPKKVVKKAKAPAKKSAPKKKVVKKATKAKAPPKKKATKTKAAPKKTEAKKAPEKKATPKK